MKNKQVSISPHITSNNSVRRIMLDVLIALLPAVICSVIFFGLYSLFLIVLSCCSALVTELLFNVIRKKEQSIGDLSFLVTGVLLALNLPPTVPFYLPIVGSFVAITTKMLFGGIGKNFANPAITGRIFLLLAWSGFMTSFVQPISWAVGECFKFFSCAITGSDISVITSATPLSGGCAKLLDMFLGSIGGSIGETCSLALIIGGIYLCIRKVIDYKIPLIFISSTALFTLIFGGASDVLPGILSGGLLLGGIFMATDYATSPNSFWGVVIYSFLGGFLTALIRYYGSYPDGVSFAILLINIITPLLDKYIRPRPFGYNKTQKRVKGVE